MNLLKHFCKQIFLAINFLNTAISSLSDTIKIQMIYIYLNIFLYKSGGDHRNNPFDFVLLPGPLIGCHLRGAQSEHLNNNQMPFDCCDD